MTVIVPALVAALAVGVAPRSASAQGRILRLLERLQREPEPAAPEVPAVDALGPWLKRLHETVPGSAAAFAELNLPQLQEAASSVETWSALWGRVAVGRPPDEQLEIVGRLHDVKASVDRQLENLLARRAEFAALPNDAARHEALRRYLQATSTFIDLSGRLRYLLVDVIGGAANSLAEDRGRRAQLVALLLDKRSSVGAEVLAIDLFDRPRDSRRQPQLSASEKLTRIELIASSGSIELVDVLARFALDENTPPTQVLAAAEAIRALGLPQDPRPGQSSDIPAPPITAAKLRERLVGVDTSEWAEYQRPSVEALLGWLSLRDQHGLEGNSYRLGQFEVQSGDWLLMRNPSPYNLFTDLSPGLFTHVGVAAMETASDGKRRMVIVDLPERGTTMPATNVEAFLDRTRHYVFLRHPDATAARRMGEAAVAMVGNPTEFDLNFRTDRVAQLKGSPLEDQKIHTYCAGFLLVCAQQTGLPRETFFPIIETTADGFTRENMASLGLSLGEGFISPTGALFAPQLTIAGRREPMYDATREIEEAVFDHFARLMQERELQPSPTLFQMLRVKVAEASKTNPILAKALAASANVSEDMDLVAAAKAAAIVETLDDVAYGASGEYLAARLAILQGGATEQPVRLASGEDVDVEKYRRRHAELTARWDQGRLPPRELRIELVKYYSEQGRRQIEERFFSGEK